MPIFQDDLGGDRGTLPTKQTTPPLSNSPLPENKMRRKISEESIRTELCEGPLLDSPPEERVLPNGQLNTTYKFPLLGTSDRSELIQRLKRGESPTWLPNRNVGAQNIFLESLLQDYDQTALQRSTTPTSSPPLLPSAEISQARQPTNELEQSGIGLQIERPRSALHSGDFTEDPRQSSIDENDLSPKNKLRTGPSWLSTTPPRNFSPFQLDSRFPPPDVFTSFDEPRSRAPSLSSSYSSSFIFKPPTSPLVQSESNDDLDLSSRINPIDITPASQRNPRRHTLNSSHSVQSTSSIPTSSSFNKPLPHLRRDNTYPYQAHQPRRSFTANATPYSASATQTPISMRSRRPSFSENSPLHHASMVGSYEESILRGRMSTTPSKPLDFVAQIGVLGLGKCKSNLKCPAHVTIPFPAVFYSYETTSHGRTSKSDEGPSPYVGQIDIENNLKNPDEARDAKRKRSSANPLRDREEDVDMLDGPTANLPSEREVRRAEKQKRRSTSPRAPPGGSYRIPEKGQLQIVIKNPNKTAVKLFLVPYDLTGMEPGTKTFIRQRSYSGGPIIASAISSNQQPPTISPMDRSTLRYLVHLHICSPSRGRFYLYKSIRVVFANRVPDGKEKLRNEISLPDPRFSVYKPGRDSSLGLGLGLNSGAGASLAAEKAFRRRSSGFPLAALHRTSDSMDGITQALERGFGGSSAYHYGRDRDTTPIQSIPFSLYQKPAKNGDLERRDESDDIQSPTSSKSSQPPGSRDSGTQMSWTSNSPGIGDYGKLSKGDAGYGGNIFSGSPNGKQIVAEGLLAKKLRDLGVGILSLQDQVDDI